MKPVDLDAEIARIRKESNYTRKFTEAAHNPHDIRDILYLLKALDKLQKWKDRLIDEAVITWVYKLEHEENPAMALHDVICWHVRVALDPAVSKEAHDLHERIRELEGQVSALRSELRFPRGEGG